MRWARRSVRVFRGPADHYAGPGERIMEFGCGKSQGRAIGGPVSFRQLEPTEDGKARMRVEIYAVEEGEGDRLEVVVCKGVKIWGGERGSPMIEAETS